MSSVCVFSYFHLVYSFVLKREWRMLSTPWCEKSENTRKRSAMGARRNLPKGSVLSSEEERLCCTVGSANPPFLSLGIFPSCKINSDGHAPHPFSAGGRRWFWVLTVNYFTIFKNWDVASSMRICNHIWCSVASCPFIIIFLKDHLVSGP